MGTSPGSVRRPLAAAVLALAIAGCGGSPTSPSPTLSPSPTASPGPTQSPTPSPMPTPTPTFVATGSMRDARMDATATLLRDGKVLIAGGSTNADAYGRDALASAELYDPAAGKFTPAGSMTTARAGATATLLHDGRVLIAGGLGCRTQKCSPENVYGAGGGALASAELYDPATGKFSATGSMVIARANSTATLLPDGRVFFAGADGLATEVYDPTTGRFARSGTVKAVYETVEAVLVPGGKVLLVGPVQSGGPSAELDDPASGKSTAISINLPPGVLAAAESNGVQSTPETATSLKDGRVLLSIFDRLLTYDPVSGSFTQSGSMAELGQWLEPATMLLPDGNVLIAGGLFIRQSDNVYVATDHAGLYDSATGFHLISSLGTPRDYETATLLPNGTVLIAGGVADDESGLSSAELFRP